MPAIHLLSEDTINKISAGEVIEGPKAVVKELAENAIDAGAGSVTVEIKDGGISLIRITDDGKGIAADDVMLAFTPHATSKIRDASDLFGVRSLGFRGEALASVDSVSRMEMLSRQHDDFIGVRYTAEGGKNQQVTEAGCPEGTTFIVRDLFFNTPARKKFLKKPVTEAGYIGDVMEKLALSHPSIAFKFINQNQLKLETSGNNNLKDCIYKIFGRTTAYNLLPVSFDGVLPDVRPVVLERGKKKGEALLKKEEPDEVFDNNRKPDGTFDNKEKPFENSDNITGLSNDNKAAKSEAKHYIRIHGFIGSPSVARGTGKGIIYFINGRYIQSNIITKAIREAYEPYLMLHKFPFCCFNIEMDPSDTDVNVHPQKMEIRFSNGPAIYKTVFDAVSNALKSTELIPDAGMNAGVKSDFNTHKGSEKYDVNFSNDGKNAHQAADSDGPSLNIKAEDLITGDLKSDFQGNSYKSLSDKDFEQENKTETSFWHIEKTSDGESPDDILKQGISYDLNNTDKHDIIMNPDNIQKQESTDAKNEPVPDASFEDPLIREVSSENNISPYITSGSNRPSDPLSGNNKLRDSSTGDSKAVDPLSGNNKLRDSSTGDSKAVDLSTGNNESEDLLSGNNKLTDRSAENNKLRELSAVINKLSDPSAEIDHRVEKANQLTFADNDSRFMSEKAVKEARIIGQVFLTYWIIEYDGAMYIVDQHAAHEKVNYERFMKEIRSHKVIQQEIMPPVIVTLTLSEEQILNEHMDDFEAAGFTIEPFGGNDYQITAVPFNIPDISREDYFREMLDSLLDEKSAAKSEDFRMRVATMACKAAIKGNTRFDAAEMKNLLDELLTLDNPYNCPHGRPTMVRFSKYDLDRMFKRIVD
jgi:DNA mismatch repair protein MutL